MSCQRVSNNIAWGCPPRMSDGRLFTDYRPRCDANLEFAAPMTSSHDYRQFLLHKGSDIIDSNRYDASVIASCGPCKQPFEQGTMLPESDRVICDKISCSRLIGGPGGLGTGREYGSTEESRVNDALLLEGLKAQSERYSSGNACGCASAAQGDFGPQYAGGGNWTEQRFASPGAGSPMSWNASANSCN